MYSSEFIPISLKTYLFMRTFSCLFSRFIPGSASLPDPGQIPHCWGACQLQRENHEQAECSQDVEDSPQCPGKRIQPQPLGHLLGKPRCLTTCTYGRYIYFSHLQLKYSPLKDCCCFQNLIYLDLTIYLTQPNFCVTSSIQSR